MRISITSPPTHTHTHRMDQAASVISTSNSALYISFYPTLSAQPIELPTERTDPPAVFVIANSLVVSDKAVAAKTRYNLRVVETLVGARALANRLGIKIGREEKVTFRAVLGRWISGDAESESGKEVEVDKLKDGLEGISEALEDLKPPPEKVMDGQLGLTMEEMVDVSGLSGPEFHQLYLSSVEGRYPIARYTFILADRRNGKKKKKSRSDPLPPLQSREARIFRSTSSSSFPRALPARVSSFIGRTNSSEPREAHGRITQVLFGAV